MFYRYYFWQLDDKTKNIIHRDIVEKLEKISPHTVPQLIATYKNTNGSSASRHAAALTLISADKEVAETLFLEFLERKSSRDNKIIAAAILHLGIAVSDKAYEGVIELIESPNEDVRVAVAGYLGHFNTVESIKLLEGISKKDTSKKVRGMAEFGLSELQPTYVRQ